MIEQTGKPLQVKDKYITNVFKGEQKLWLIEEVTELGEGK